MDCYHDWELVWLTDDLEGFRCKTCGKEQIDIEGVDKEVATYYIDKINHMEGILEDIWGLLYKDKQSYEYYGQIYAHLMVEMQTRKTICDILIPYYLIGLLPENKIEELDKAIETYKRCNKEK